MFSSQVLANPDSYIFPKNCRNQVDWAILDLNTIFWAVCDLLKGNYSEKLDTLK